MTQHTVSITPEALASLATIKPRRPYVIIEGGLAQDSSDDVVIIDLDFLKDGDLDFETLETAELALDNLTLLGFEDSHDAHRVRTLINRIKDDLELHD
jgi:hypothetical protein